MSNNNNQKNEFGNTEQWHRAMGQGEEGGHIWKREIPRNLSLFTPNFQRSIYLNAICHPKIPITMDIFCRILQPIPSLQIRANHQLIQRPAQLDMNLNHQMIGPLWK